MGQDKAVLAVDGIPMLRRVCLAAQQCAAPVYVVTPWPKRYRELLREIPVALLPETPINAEPDGTQGPLLGFADALSQLQRLTQAQLRPDWLLLLACDLPNLQPAVLQGWAALLPDVPSTTLALLPQNPAGWWEPLCGFYRTAVWAELNAYVAQGGSSFQGWLSQIVVQPLPYDPALLFNCNRPEDLQTAQQLADAETGAETGAESEP